ncbi:MAG: hypothetical protein B7Z58_17350 [Acidiphilium sp. 37-64-53]|uniref:hypothetical protein n=1 Tax=Acidiphilium TaxID=522 RepID=UPI000BDA3359|nr:MULTISPECIES: hypothetical protein [Acidiphilium]MEE3504576.1 hypothetical protein [Acidiphilium acidophilum]OYV99901.1 MAG: hypothetical protein B7Z58_17350 [Acidiphilium sp. 37-64-53]HQT84971.1 hypothetical protein [Acidiphilium rubrum]
MSSAQTAMTPSVETAIERLTSAMRLMIETQNTQGKILMEILRLAQPSTEETPLEAAMAEIAGALRDQTVVLERIDETMASIAPDVEAGVLRGLAGALGVEEAGDPVPGAAAEPPAPAGEAG